MEGLCMPRIDSNYYYEPPSLVPPTQPQNYEDIRAQLAKNKEVVKSAKTVKKTVESEETRIYKDHSEKEDGDASKKKKKENGFFQILKRMFFPKK